MPKVLSNHENVNCNLKHKAEWLFAKNPRGKVPILELNGKILYESEIVSKYIDQQFDGRQLVTKDPWKRAEEAMLMGDLDKSISGFYGLVRTTDEEQRKEGLDKINFGFKVLEDHLNIYKKEFIGGDEPGFTDYMFWPFLERMSLLMMDVIELQPSILKYFNLMLKDKSVIACRHHEDLHKQFITAYKSGNHQYDIGEVDDLNVTKCRV